MEELIRHNVEPGRLRFTTNVAEGVAHSFVQMIAIGKPSDEEGSADLQFVIAAARYIGSAMMEYEMIANESTVPVGTADKVRRAVREELNQRGRQIANLSRERGDHVLRSPNLGDSAKLLHFAPTVRVLPAATTPNSQPMSRDRQ